MRMKFIFQKYVIEIIYLISDIHPPPPPPPPASSAFHEWLECLRRPQPMPHSKHNNNLYFKTRFMSIITFNSFFLWNIIQALNICCVEAMVEYVLCMECDICTINACILWNLINMQLHSIWYEWMEYMTVDGFCFVASAITRHSHSNCMLGSTLTDWYGWQRIIISFSFV